MEDFMTAAKKVSALPDKYGYCLHGGAGGINSWLMFAAAMNGTNEFFDEAGNSRINEPDSVAGIQFLIDVYQNGYAPKDSINWGFGETVAAFYSGSCAMLDQDPDALALIAQNMAADDFAVAPMPLGPAGKAFPTIGFAGWSMLSTSEDKKEAWQLISYLSSRGGNLTWSKQVGVIPVYQGAEKHPYFAGAHFQGWFTELNDERYVPTLMPTYLDGWATFADVIATQSSQEALLNVTSARRVADRWAEELTQARKKWRRTGK
jgi:multiple sugar transport system substrate-binding protein